MNRGVAAYVSSLRQAAGRCTSQVPLRVPTSVVIRRLAAS
jgi:hypothetical protein